MTSNQLIINITTDIPANLFCMIALIYFNRTDGLLDDMIIVFYKNQFCLMKEIDASMNPITHMFDKAYNLFILWLLNIKFRLKKKKHIFVCLISKK